MDRAIDAEDILAAERLWVVDLQATLKRSERYVGKLNAELGLFEQDGLLRCAGRFKRSALPYSSKFPILLPKNHHVTDLIILHCHSIVSHNGTNETLAELRQNYWVPCGRQLVRKLLHNYRICKWFKGMGHKIPRPADLPEGRVQGATAFVDIGIDFAGPLYVKSGGDLQKAHICMFTCSSSRAVHLETVPNSSTAAFIRCLKRFVARRGLPYRITSDNAKTFKNANKEIGKLLKSAEVQEYSAQRNIVWKFILERAPWFGGFYERMLQW